MTDGRAIIKLGLKLVQSVRTATENRRLWLSRSTREGE